MKKIILIYTLFIFLKSNQLAAQWQIKNTDTTTFSEISDIKFSDPENGIAATLQGFILKTTDGGESWQKSDAKQQSAIYQLKYLSANEIVAAGNEKVMLSTDTGNSWNTISTFPAKQILSLHFFSRKEGIVAGYDGIYYTANSGLQWDTSWSMKNNGYKFGEISAIHFYNALNGFAIGYGYPNSTGNLLFDYLLLTTNNSGQTWSRVSNLPEASSCLFYLNKDTGFVGGQGGKIFKTMDGGKQWTPTTLGNLTLKAIQFINDTTGFAVGSQDGRIPEGNYSTFSISRTVDGGNHWTTFDTIGAGLKTIFFINKDTGFVAGEVEMIMKTKKSIFGLPANYPFHLFNVTAVSEPMAQEVSSIFPNPFLHEITIKYQKAASFQLLLSNTQGQIVLSKKSEGLTQEINVNTDHLPKGIYFVQILREDKNEFYKLLKQ